MEYMNGVPPIFFILSFPANEFRAKLYTYVHKLIHAQKCLSDNYTHTHTHTHTHILVYAVNRGGMIFHKVTGEIHVHTFIKSMFFNVSPNISSYSSYL